MVGVCFHREVKNWMQDQWSWTFSNFGITDIYETDHQDGDFDIYQKTINIKTAQDLPKDRPLVLLAPPDGKYVKGTESLDTFDHPENAIYIFGGSHDVMTKEWLNGVEPDHLVYIPFVEYECYSFTAANITLWDRRIKVGNFG